MEDAVCWLAGKLIQQFRPACLLWTRHTLSLSHQLTIKTIPNTATGQSDLGHFSIDLLDDPRLCQIDS